MATILTRLEPPRVGSWLWAPVLVGLLAMYVPSYIDVAQTFGQAQQGTSAPVIVLLAAWLIWRGRSAFSGPVARDAAFGGLLLLISGLALFVIGRSQSFFQLEMGSQIPLIAGAVLLILGRKGLARFWFPILFLLFTIPVPGSLLDQLLLPLKQWVSAIVDSGLHLAGYPIARNGVVLMIGPYDLLIADACSGLNSMIALTGVGLLYVYVARSPKPWLNIVLLASIIPIAFVSNVLRVALLVLTTYYAGDQAGRAFHDQAAYLEIVLAFGAFFALDHLLSRFWGHGKSQRSGKPQGPDKPRGPGFGTPVRVS